MARMEWAARVSKAGAEAGLGSGAERMMLAGDAAGSAVWLGEMAAFHRRRVREGVSA